MKKRLLFLAFLVFVFTSCPNSNTEGSDSIKYESAKYDSAKFDSAKFER
jgi:hypothetical protein